MCGHDHLLLVIALVKAAVVGVIAVDEVVAEVELAVEADVVSSLAPVVVVNSIRCGGK